MKRLGSILGIVLLMVSTAAGAFPTRPSAPLVGDNITPCSLTTAFYRHAYDTDPGGPGAYIELGLYDVATDTHGKVFLVIVISHDDVLKAYIELPGRGVEEWNRAKLMGTYSHPCEIVEQVTKSPG